MIGVFMMNESKKIGVRVIAWSTLIVGLMFILNGIQTQGEAVENMVITISSGQLFFIGAAITLASGITIIILSISKRK